jgi:hypothetical protein
MQAQLSVHTRGLSIWSAAVISKFGTAGRIKLWISPGTPYSPQPVLTSCACSRQQMRGVYKRGSCFPCLLSHAWALCPFCLAGPAGHGSSQDSSTEQGEWTLSSFRICSTLSTNCFRPHLLMNGLSSSPFSLLMCCPLDSIFNDIPLFAPGRSGGLQEAPAFCRSSGKRLSTDEQSQ